jgi:hypothetical protein
MLQFIRFFIEIIQPILIPLCFCAAWLFIGILGTTIVKACTETVDRAKQMHRIPCTECVFFTDDYHLKCTVQPHLANTEAAIDCRDYRSRSQTSFDR